MSSSWTVLTPRPANAMATPPIPSSPGRPGSPSGPGPARLPLLLLALAGLTLIVLLPTFLRRSHAPSPSSAASRAPETAAPIPAPPGDAKPAGARGFARSGNRPSEQVVADRLAVFARKRRDAAMLVAQRRGVPVPEDVLQFFAAVEAGDWSKTQALYEALHARRRSDTDPRAADLEAVWPAVHETLGVAEVAATWPAKSLIEYGEAILNALRPGAVYLGGTDAGRFAPSLFNDVGGVEGRVLLTQNALADRTYLDYVNLLHGTRIEGITPEESDRAFQTYIQDAQRRALHDAANPDGPRQVRPGEVIDISPDGRVSVSGQVAVMAINEGLLQTLLAKNPNLTFALEESFPLKSLYADSLPAGPIMELRAGGTDPSAVQQRADAALDLWRSTARQFQADSSLPPDSPVRNAWADMATAQGSYFADHHLPAQAEETWRQALAIAPANEKAMFRLAEHLAADQRVAEAIQVVDRFLQVNPATPDMVKDLRRTLGELPKRP